MLTVLTAVKLALTVIELALVELLYSSISSKGSNGRLNEISVLVIK